MINKSLATLEAELETYLSWYDSNPMKAVLVSLTRRDIAAIKAEQARLARKVELEAKAEAFAALPWYKRLFRSA